MNALVFINIDIALKFHAIPYHACRKTKSPL